MKNYSVLKVSSHDKGIVQINLHRPEKYNALSQVLLDELGDVLTIIKSTDDIRAVLLTGSGKAFSAGADISAFAELDAIKGQRFAELGQAIFRQFEQLGKPSLAAINGYAFGGGCELAMATTLRIASQQAQFAQPEVKLGLIPGFGGSQRLARLVGKGRALDLCVSGRRLSAEDALQWGLVTEVTEPEQLLPRAFAILNDILSRSPVAVARVMQVIDMGFDLPLTDALHLEAVHFGLCCASADKQEGVSAFLEKREPVFDHKSTSSI